MTTVTQKAEAILHEHNAYVFPECKCGALISMLPQDDCLAAHQAYELEYAGLLRREIDPTAIANALRRPPGPFYVCKDCGVELLTQADADAHMSETLPKAPAFGSSHTLRHRPRQPWTRRDQVEAVVAYLRGAS